MSACSASGVANCVLTISTVVGSTTAVGVTATSPITFSATGDLSLQSSTSVTGVAGSAFTLLADTDGINGGNLAFNGNTDAGISSVTSVTSVVLSGDDLLLNTATGIAAGVKAGVRLDDKEWRTVKGLGADFYCYNLVQCMILAAHRGLPVVGIALPEGAKLDEQMMIALVR